MKIRWNKKYSIFLFELWRNFRHVFSWERKTFRIRNVLIQFRIRKSTSGYRIWTRILLFTPVAFKMSTKNKCFLGTFFCFFTIGTSVFKDSQLLLIRNSQNRKNQDLFFFAYSDGRIREAKNLRIQIRNTSKIFIINFIFIQVSFLFGPKRHDLNLGPAETWSASRYVWWIRIRMKRTRIHNNRKM